MTTVPCSRKAPRDKTPSLALSCLQSSTECSSTRPYKINSSVKKSFHRAVMEKTPPVWVWPCPAGATEPRWQQGQAQAAGHRGLEARAGPAGLSQAWNGLWASYPELFCCPSVPKPTARSKQRGRCFPWPFQPFAITAGTGEAAPVPSQGGERMRIFDKLISHAAGHTMPQRPCLPNAICFTYIYPYLQPAGTGSVPSHACSSISGREEELRTLVHTPIPAPLPVKRKAAAAGNAGTGSAPFLFSFYFFPSFSLISHLSLKRSDLLVVAIS